MSFSTADLCDAHPTRVSVVAPMFRDFGSVRTWSGRISTVKVFEDNVLVRAALEEQGHLRVLVIDGGGSLRCALVGDMLAELARANGWGGIIIYGCLRDTAKISTMPIGIKAISTHPQKSTKRGAGERDIPVTFGGVTFTPGEYVYADADGVVVAPAALV